MKWASQGFFNSPYSGDTGRYRFAVQRRGKSLKHDIIFNISDCSETICLELGAPYFDASYSAQELARVLTSIERRKKKSATIRRVIVKACDKIDAALDKDREMCEGLLAAARRTSRESGTKAKMTATPSKS